MEAAERFGFGDRLMNLAGRPEAVGVPLRQLLRALVATGGLVNAAKRALHGALPGAGAAPGCRD
eukprot:1949785-Lingulodinium_polyedra.AAC.1